MFPIVHRVRALDRQEQTEDLILHMREIAAEESIEIDFSRVARMYPNGAVPFAAAVAQYRELGRTITASGMSDSVARTHVMEPMLVERFVRHETHLTHNVWQYRDEAEAQKLANLYVDALVDQVRCEAGVVDALNWCLYEVMDNVFQHSRASSGFVMMQIHRQNRKCVISVGDTGIGIQRSLLNGLSAGSVDASMVREAHTAIEHAVQRGVTSKGKLNQGNGLFGLQRTAQLNGGELKIISGRGIWSSDPDGLTESDLSRPVLDPEMHQSTTVDWQLDCSRKVKIEEALGSEISVGDFLESIETPDGHYRVAVLDLEESLGSRAKGTEVRNRLANYLQAGAKFIVLDFAGVGVVSSSFADEVLGKLALEMGELEFRRRIFVDSASPTNRSLIETAISLRLSTGA
jgi:anti-anti-sigma regulatory factor